MNKTDKQKILKAIDLLLHEDCKLQESVMLLGSMVGLRFPTMEMLCNKKMPSVSIFKLLKSKGNRAFNYASTEDKL